MKLVICFFATHYSLISSRRTSAEAHNRSAYGELLFRLHFLLEYTSAAMVVELEGLLGRTRRSTCVISLKSHVRNRRDELGNKQF